MLDVSSAWRAAILNPMVTRQFRVMARIDLAGSILVSGLAGITTPTGDHTSKPEQLADGIIETDNAYASLDSAWTLGDGKRAASTIYGQTGYVGVQLSGTGGVFTVQEQLTFTMTSPTMINHITVAFDDKLAEYAVDFDIAFFNAAGARNRTLGGDGKQRGLAVADIRDRVHASDGRKDLQADRDKMVSDRAHLQGAGVLLRFGGAGDGRRPADQHGHGRGGGG